MLNIYFLVLASSLELSRLWSNLLHLLPLMLLRSFTSFEFSTPCILTSSAISTYVEQPSRSAITFLLVADCRRLTFEDCLEPSTFSLSFEKCLGKPSELGILSLFPNADVGSLVFVGSLSISELRFKLVVITLERCWKCSHIVPEYR